MILNTWYKSKESKGLHLDSQESPSPHSDFLVASDIGAFIINYSKNIIKSEDSEKQML